jgi:amino acid adenylation domain-containing protein
MYVAQLVCELEGDLSQGALVRAWEKVLERHAALRTTFFWQELDRPVQVVFRRVDLPWSERDLRDLPANLQRERLESHLAEDRARGFEVSRPPLIRLMLFRTGESSFWLVLTLHQMLLDGWSVPLVLEDVLALYDAERRGGHAELPHRPPYRDYIAWLLQQDLSEAEAYWRRVLGGFSPSLGTLDARPPDGPDEGYGEDHLVIAQNAVEGARALARAHRVTLNTLIQAAWGLLLGHSIGSRDVVFGTVVSGRPAELPGIESTVGLFINTLPARLRIPEEGTISEWLRQIQERQAEMRRYEHSPLVEVQRWAGIPPNQPLFESILVFQNYPVAASLAGRSTALGIRGARTLEQTNYDLTLVAEPGTELRLSLAYPRRRFQRSSILRMLRQLQSVLEGLGEAQRPAELSLLTAIERHQVVHEWNDTGGELGNGTCFHRLFEAQAERTPDRVAVVGEEEHLTYAELDRQADALAWRLRRLGMAPETRVGICLERSPQAIVALLGVLKAGGAYVPLEAAQPRERLAAILEGSGALFLLTRENLLGTLPTGRFQVLCIDRPDLRDSMPVPGPEPNPAQLAYVIFTSGSTGRPKGVAVEHRQLVHYVTAVLARLRLPEGASFATVSSLATDLGNTAVFPALCSGGRLHVVPEWRIADAAALEEYCARHPIDCLKIVPSHLAALLSGGRPHEVLPRQWLVLGGEAADRSLVARLRELAPRCEILNHYGPTETTVGASTHRLGFGGEPAATPPIGRPLPGVRLILLGWNRQPVPIGAPGEIHIGGSGVARGYLGDPAQTAEKLIPDPWGDGARLYRTGDLARLLPDGAVDLLGRIDHQVKVRGHRIETTEIEAVLREDESLLEAVVIALGDTPGERRLVAYVVPRVGADIRAEELRHRVRDRLPDFMMPSAIVGLEALPRLPSGKVDRRALPAPEWRGGGEDEDAAPRSPAEELLAGIWCEVLGVERVGRDDDFFALGGHSLLATQVVSRARRVFGVELALRELFEAPRLADLASRIAEAWQAGHGVSAPPLVRVDRQGGLPLSFAQQRLWFFDQLEPGRSVYNVPVPVRIEGNLRVAVLASALREIVRRHESLRTRFAMVDGAPVQVIAAPGPERLPVVDLRSLTGPARDREVQRLTEEDARLPFDLSSGPLWRTSLLCLGSEEHVLLSTMHHIVIDGWSMEVLGREVRALYLSFLAGERSPLPELPVQYADYAAWQRGWLCGQVLAGELAYWRQQLAGAPPLLELPWDRPRPAVQSLRGALREVRLSLDLSERLIGFGRREGATTFIALLAAFQALLARLSGQAEVSVGAPVAGRAQVETEGLIGFFVNTLVLRTDLSGDPSFRELLTRVRETALQAHAHQDLPFEKLVEELSPQRSLSYAPLFQTLLMLQNAARGGELELPGLRPTSLRAHSGTAKFDLTLDMEDSPEGLRGVLEYSTDLFDGATICRWAGHFTRLLEGAVAAPGERLSMLPLLSEPERLQLSVEWNDTAVEVPEAPVHRLFEAQVERTPAAVAVVFDSEVLTYRDLNARANRLARHLRGLGVGPGALVGIALERSLDLPVAVLGVLKSGGAYLPLDPAYPAERLSFMLRDSQVPVVLSQLCLAASLPEYGGTVVFLDGEDLIGEEGSFEGGAGPEDLAYVIYTSGSTGRPKGVQVQHRALTNFLLAMGHEPGLSPEDVLLAVTSLSFDIAALELYLPLLIGARLEIAPRDVAKDGMRLLQLLRGSGSTVVQATPSTWRLLLEAGWEESDRLRKALTGGEALTAELATLLGRRADELWNVYGPTETAVWSTVLRVAGETGPTLAIGRPIANTCVYIVDCWGAPAPIGVPGELCIGGMGVACGYLDRPELTADRFVPDPWGAAPGLRLYRTGDLARLRPDGILEFLGRIDNQVKIRGFRIELGEIEAALGLHPAVAQAAVVARDDRGDLRLVAYLSPGPGYEPGPGRGSALLRPLPESGRDEVTAHQLRAQLAEALPAYMLPSAFVALPSLPLTPNGKLDRKALPGLEPWHAAELSMAAAPIERPIEDAVRAIWAQTLRGESPERNESFFELGGHSLLAMQLVTRLRDAFQADLGVRDIFEAPTVAGLAQKIEERLRSGHDFQASPITQVPRNLDLPLSFDQQRLWYLDQLAPGSVDYNISTVLRVTGRLDLRVLAASLQEIVRRHESLRTTFRIVGDHPVQVIELEAALDLSVADLAFLPEPERSRETARLVADERLRSFDLARGPLLRVRVLRCGLDEHVLQLTAHHIICDGGSAAIFVRELTVLYPSFFRGEASPLPELPVQYADFSAWQRASLQGELLERQLAFWKRRLEGAPMRLDLPLDRPRPATSTGRGGSFETVLPEELGQSLRQLSTHQGTSLFVTMLAAFETLLFSLTGQEDFLVGANVAHRNRSELEPLIGFFVNQVALRVSLADDPTFLELLRAVRTSTLEAWTHQEVPFEKVVEAVRPERGPGQMPLFQAKIDFEVASAALEIPGLSFRSMDTGLPPVHLDLLLAIHDDGRNLTLTLTYDAEIFLPITIQRWMARLESLLRTVAEHPTIRMSALAAMAQANEREGLAARERELAEASLQKLQRIAPRAARPAGTQLETT